MTVRRPGVVAVACAGALALAVGAVGVRSADQAPPAAAPSAASERPAPTPAVPRPDRSPGRPVADPSAPAPTGVPATSAPASRSAHPTTPTPGGAPSPTPSVAPVTYTGRIIVKAGSPATAERALAEAGVAAGPARRLGTGAVVVPVAAGQDVAATQALAARPEIEYAERERRLQPAQTPNDPAYPQQWDLPAMSVPQAWPLTTGLGVPVAVIDTGRLDHPDIAGHYLPGYDFISEPEYSLDGDGRDADPTDAGDWAPYGACDLSRATTSSWHGLHVAGTIAATVDNAAGIAGIAPGARVVPLRALGRCGGSDADITDALVWATGANVPGMPPNPYPAKIVNLSLGGTSPCSPTEQAAIDIATSRGALVVVAAGNDGGDVATYAPANCRGVLVVGATNPDGTGSSFSNRGDAVTISAPGARIPGLANTGSRGADPGGWTLSMRSGTSMAAPHVSALAALLWSAHPAASAADIRRALLAGALSFSGPTQGYGVGIVDARASLAALPASGPTPTLTGVTPPSVRVTGGEEVTVTGTGLTGAAVSVDGRPATMLATTPTTATFRAPAAGAGARELVVATPGGTVGGTLLYGPRYGVRHGGPTFTPVVPS